MKILRKLTSFVLVFSLLAGTVAVMSAAVYADEPSDDAALSEVSAAQPDPTDEQPADETDVYKPRLTAPSYSNPYYYSDNNIFYRYGWGMPNCTCYAWGRAYEITGEEPDLCVYSAHLWYDYNIDYGPYAYGTEPKLGAIACWKYTSGISGHVAVVEKIENGMITFSNSAYSGTEFYTDTVPVSDPSDGRKTWIFQGYIYIGDFENPDGEGGQELHDADEPVDGDVYCITDEDGVNLRCDAGTSSAVIGGITCGQTVVVTEKQSVDGYTWGYTVYRGTKGWFALDFAELIQEVDPAPADDTPNEQDPADEAPVDEDPAEVSAPDAPAEEPTRIKYPFEYAPTPANGFMLGDLDGDGQVTIMDATRIQLIIAEMFVPTKQMLYAGDYDGDEKLTILDATRIRYDIAFDRI